MFAASLPWPVTPVVPGLPASPSAVSVAVLDRVMAQSFVAHVRASWGLSLRCENAPKPKQTRKPKLTPSLPVELMAVADTVCLILGVGPMVQPVKSQPSTRPTSKPTMGIAADALARVQVEIASDEWCAVMSDIPKRRAVREKARAKAWKRWEGTAGPGLEKQRQGVKSQVALASTGWWPLWWPFGKNGKKA